MADNVAVTPGAGADIATDDVGGVQFQKVKLDIGGDGVSIPLTAANPMPVSGTFFLATQPVSAAALPLPAGAATEATLASVVRAEDSVGTSGDFGLVVLAQRRDADTSAVDTDGDYATLKMDETGRLKVSTLPASILPTTLTITANAQNRGLDVTRFSNIMLHCNGTFSTINNAFEGSLDATTDSDGNWFAVQAVRSNANTIETTTGNLSATPTYAWELSVNALKRFRVRSTAYTSGTQTWIFQPGSYATEPIPAAQVSGTQAVSGSVTVSGTVTASATVGPAAHDAAVSGNPLRVAGRALTTNYATVATGDVADLITTLVGAVVQKPYSIPEADYVGIDSITASVTATQIRAATASNKAYVTCLSLSHDALGGAGEIQIRSTPVVSTTATLSSNTLVMSATYGWKVGDLVYVTASGVTGLTAATYYYILTVSAASLTFSATRGGSTLAISGTSVNATLSKIMFRCRLQTAALTPVNLPCAIPVDGGTGLAIEVCTPVSLVSGRVDFNVRGYVAP